MNELETLDLVGVAAAIAGGQLSARQATAWSIERLQTTGRHFNAVFRIDAEAALARAAALDEHQARGGALGPLHGVPLAHKDLFGVAGRECSAGSLILRGHVAPATAWAVQTLEDAGQVNVASLHMAEFALSPTGYNGHHGHGLNPWNAAYACGGSSSGSGIAVAARLVFGSLGSDTGGSIRHPAAMCGITGLKTTAGRVSLAGVVPLSPTLDCVGPMAQSARDCARLLSQLVRPNRAENGHAARPAPDFEATLNGDLRGVRIGVPHAYYREALDPEVAAALQASLDALRGRGASLHAVPVPDMARVNALAQVVMQAEAAAMHRDWMQTRPQDYAEQVRLRIAPGLDINPERLAEALALRQQVQDDWLQSCMADCDLVHLPTLPVHTPTIAATTAGDVATVLQGLARVTHATRGINYLGLPAISVPTGLSAAGLPLAFQLVGRPKAEALLLRAADAYQRDTDWHRRRPPVHAPSTGDS
jgi:aspartyl-tRNA(Asn)/glutamyl-tRNA(Gln) amidotransferase subunit A